MPEVATPDSARSADHPPAGRNSRTPVKSVLRFRARGKMRPSEGTLPLDGTPKQCYHAVTQTVKSYLFLSSSPSVRRSEHCFGVPSGVADTASF